MRQKHGISCSVFENSDIVKWISKGYLLLILANMRGRNLIELLKTFDNEDWRKSTIYIKHSVGSQSREAKLFEYIKRYKRNLDSSKLYTESIKSTVAPNITLESFYTILHRLLFRIEEYLMVIELRNSENSFERDVLKARAYKRRGLNKQFVSEIRRIKAQADKSETINIWNNAHLTRLFYEYYISDATDMHLIKEALFENAITFFEAFYNQLGIIWLSERENILKSREEVPNIKIPYFLKNKSLLKRTMHTPLLHLVYEAATNRNEENYLKLKAEYAKQKNKMSTDIRFFVFINLLNLNIYLIGVGMIKYGHDMLDFYKEGLDSGVLLYNNRLSEKRFLNIINRAFKLGKGDWIQEFRKQWSKSVETKDYIKVMAIADAYEAFSRKDYKKTLKVLDISFYARVDLSLRANWLKLCSYYELYHDNHYGDKLIDYLETFRSYLNKNARRIDKKKIDGSKNLLSVIDLMINNPGNNDLIRDFLEEHKFVVFRSWVESKIN